MTSQRILRTNTPSAITKMKVISLLLGEGRSVHTCSETIALYLFTPRHSSSVAPYRIPTRLFGTSGPAVQVMSPIDSKPALIDIDCNLFHKDLRSVVVSSSINDNDPLAILRHPSTKEAGIIGVLTPSSTLEESVDSVALVSSVMDNNNVDGIQVLTTVGIHPYHSVELPADLDNISKIKELIVTGRGRGVVCVGECGLDYSDGFPEPECQMPWFEAQLDIAFELNMPLFFHERLAFNDFIKAIDKVQDRHPNIACPPSVVHCFTGTEDECKAYVDRGFYIGLTGFLNKGQIEGALEIQRILENGVIPLDRLMIETDAPYLGFDSCRDLFFEAEGERFSSLPSKKRKKLMKSIYPNVPSSLPLVLSSVTQFLNRGREARGEPLLTENEVASACTKNSALFFGFKI